MIKDAESGLVIADLSDHTPVTIAKGGRGGYEMCIRDRQNGHHVAGHPLNASLHAIVHDESGHAHEQQSEHHRLSLIHIFTAREIAGLSPGAVGASGKKHCIVNGKQKEGGVMSFFENTRKPVGLGGKIMVCLLYTSRCV